MSLDASTRGQLGEAKKAVIAQLDELGGLHGAWRRRDPLDAGDIYFQLKEKLRQINELLGVEGTDGL